MLRVKVLIPFHRLETDTDHVPEDVIEVSESELARIRSVNVNMVLVLGEAEAEEPKPKRKSTKK